MADLQKISQLIGQVECATTPQQRVYQLAGQVEYVTPGEIRVHHLLAQVEYEPGQGSGGGNEPGLFFANG